MTWYHWLFLISLFSSGTILYLHILRLVAQGKPSDYAPVAGIPRKGIRYSMTGAMHPNKKESARLHLTTYIAGLLYHTGTFAAFFLLYPITATFKFPNFLPSVFCIFLLFTGLCGIIILGKRIFKKNLRLLSHPDDYFSNILVTLFQLSVAINLVIPSFAPVMFVITSLLLLYIPAGKLKHMIYFFAARYHLGLFYGRRGVWPPVNISKTNDL